MAKHGDISMTMTKMILTTKYTNPFHTLIGPITRRFRARQTQLGYTNLKTRENSGSKFVEKHTWDDMCTSICNLERFVLVYPIRMKGNVYAALKKFV